MHFKVPLLKNSIGEPSGTFTFAVISFIIVSVCVILSMFKSVNVGEVSVEVNPGNTELLLGYLFTSVGTYAYRRTKTDTVVSEESPVVSEEKKQLNG